MSFEVIEHGGRRYAEIIWSGTSVETTKFYSPDKSSFQFGILAHGAGFVEEPHSHMNFERVIDDLQQMFVVQFGVLAVDFFTDGGVKFKEVTLRAGDAILLVDGAHSIRVLEKMQCISVKQGPFLGVDKDKVILEAKP